MSDKKRSALIDYCVYLIVRTVVCVVQTMSFACACGFARFLASSIIQVDVRPASEAVLLVPHAFTVTNEYESIHRFLWSAFRRTGLPTGGLPLGPHTLLRCQAPLQSAEAGCT